MLVGDYVVFIFRIDGLVLWRDIDFFERQFYPCEVFKQVRMVRGV